MISNHQWVKGLSSSCTRWKALDSTMFFLNTNGLRFDLSFLSLCLLLWLLWLANVSKQSLVDCRLNATDSYESSGKYKGQRISWVGRETSGSFYGRYDVHCMMVNPKPQHFWESGFSYPPIWPSLPNGDLDAKIPDTTLYWRTITS